MTSSFLNIDAEIVNKPDDLTLGLTLNPKECQTECQIIGFIHNFHIDLWKTVCHCVAEICAVILTPILLYGS